MTTVINNPGTGESSDSALGVIVGVVVLAIAVGLFFVYALPAIRNNESAPKDSSIDVNITLPPATPATTPK